MNRFFEVLKEKIKTRKTKVGFAFSIISIILILFGYSVNMVPLFIILTIMLIDKSILAMLRVPPFIGLELVTISVVLVGVAYGPIYGFLFGFLVLPIFDFISFIISPPIDVVLPPGIPTPDTFFYGILAILGWAFYGLLPFPILLFVLSSMKSFVLFYNAIKIGGKPNFIYLFLNPFFNYFLARLFDLHLIKFIL